MNSDTHLWLKRPAFFIGTFFGIGQIPLMPGTWASFVAAGIHWLISPLDFGVQLSMVVLFFVIGVWAGSTVERMEGETDPGRVVIDEAVGMWVALFMIPHSITLYLLGFVLFRIFDVTKLVPLNRIQALPAGWGIMLDDVGAGIYALIIIQVVVAFL